jgi:hypothetical protein
LDINESGGIGVGRSGAEVGEGICMGLESGLTEDGGIEDETGTFGIELSI